MEIGAYSFGDTPLNPDGCHRATAEAISNLHAAIVHADAVGLDYFGVGEHHTVSMPASSPGAVIAAAAAATDRIILGSAASIISTDDPVRIFQQFTTADAISGGGRIEITAGRGSSVETFPLFGHDLADYDELYANKLDLLMTINDSSSDEVTWQGKRRPAIPNLAVVPRPVNGKLPIWLATGGNAGSSARAGQLGLPVSYGIIGGAPQRFAPLAELYRRSAAQSGHAPGDTKVSVAALGLVAPTKKEALERMYPGWYNLNVEMGRLRGWPEPDRNAYLAQAEAPGAYYVGDPDDVAERIVHLHGYMGHMRHFLQMDIGGLPHEHFLESLTLLATEVKPRVQRLLAQA
ncbi:LLM class flavin-dependent oxidoreductase [Citricoccus sp. K5]|uniref:LLM class flavin-dependent oxidoreductase n=1 Tax=Citricoccus sp. K5 TaxID=2653135 RepID=UPI0012F3D10C|nr:LLM class flavin-dependent oxidoreductase [Citricoccus sp. K5]VXB03745.1 Alkanesulfonate monooxygenase SsuD/methylene tetrahydromethanopterin reductase-like flavin-dependent oxidoreductase (Luciferase family) [Citricoccus sp. K5]